MLQFNKIRLSGFKSFVDNTELLIELGLTGVVGPNGCGKSNLVEALRWVMGETSAKQMRGGEMDDVIFGGTANRPPRNVAEVVLALSNAEKSAPAQFNDLDEIEVSRRIEREKGSTYRANGKEVRARDVQLLFADSATGARSTALVSQGRVGAIINAKPAQRRTLLEEAAGITGLHSRRHEAELRLRAAETNLERLDDILVTLDTQLQNLKKQARQATRYRNLSDHIRKAEASLFFLRWRDAETALEQTGSALTGIKERVTALTGAAASAATEQAERAAALPELRDGEAAAAAALHRLIVARDGLEAEERRIADAIQAAEARLAQIADDEARERAIGADATAALERLHGERTEIEAKQADESEARERAHADVAEINARVEAVDTELSELSAAIAANEARRAALENRRRELDERMRRFTERGREIAGQIERLEADSPEAGAVAESESLMAEAEAKLADTREARSEAESRREDTQEATRAKVAKLQEVTAELARLKGEEQALERVLAVSEEDLWPPLIDAVSVEPGFEAALGAALGEDLEAPTDEAAPVHWRTLPEDAESRALPEGARSLIDVVRAPAALTRRLKQIGVVDSEDTGRLLAPKLGLGQRLVSREGGLWRWDGFTVSAGAKTAAAARLEQRNRLEDIRAEMARFEASLTDAENDRDRARSEEEAAIGGERAAKEAVEAAGRLFNEAREGLARAKERLSAHAATLSGLEEAGRGNGRELEETEAAFRTCERDLGDMPDIDRDRETAALQRADLAELRAEQLARQGRRDTLERDARTRGQRLVDIATEIRMWEGREQGSRTQIASLEARRSETRRELDGLKVRPDEIARQRNALLDTISGSEKKRNAAADALAVAEEALRQADHKLRDAEGELARAREDMVRTEGAMEQARQASHAIAERVRDRLDCRPEQLFELSGLKEGQPLPEMEASERKVERLLRERDTMGPVNLRAELEAQEMTEQIDTLNIERDDLIKAIEKLRGGINELNREGRARLLASFKEVDDHFQELFVRLFGGGRAHLELTEADDPLEAGLEIMASPPGKKLQVLSLLSGGEQALTALALLFAVFLTNPAPICVLDEVDAPLDDANVDRFCRMLEEMVRDRKTRFLIITHHRMTMARMDRLFGVTMSERGVSQLVSVDLQQAEKLRDIA